MKPEHLEHYLRNLPEDVLIAWDAPLTGPPDPDVWTDRWDLTTRQIERFFGKGGPFPAPPGISVRSYCGCPHWTISRRLLGLPRIGQFDAKTGLPFILVSSNRNRPSRGRHVVEVHPALALWRWCSENYDGTWNYKKDKKCRTELARLMSSRIEENFPDVSDDAVDAWTAWYLARRWLDGRGVVLLGNSRTGAFLLPDEPNLQKLFARFADEYGHQVI
jgi:hypothetical protein